MVHNIGITNNHTFLSNTGTSDNLLENIIDRSITIFTGVQKLQGPEISRFLPCMLQFLDNLQRLSGLQLNIKNQSWHNVCPSEKILCN